MKRIANILAVILHPIFVPVLLIILLMQVEPVLSLFFSPELQWRLMLSLSLTMVAGPIVSMYLMKRNGFIDDLTMPSLKGRSLSYILTMVYYLLTYFFVRQLQLPYLVEVLLLALILTLCIMALVSTRFKASAHMAAIGGSLAVFVWIWTFYGLWLRPWMVLIILLCGIMASARMYLQAHNLSEVAVGWAIGFVTVFTCLSILII